MLDENELRSLDSLQPTHCAPTDSLLSTKVQAESIFDDQPQGTSETASFLRRADQGIPAERNEQPTNDRTTFDQLTWRPLTLRTPYLSFFLMLTIILGSLVLFLTVSSIRNNGLGNDSASSALLFGRRFSPTLLATIYGLFVAPMLNDVRRTEIFARLSEPGGAPAEKTLCLPTRSWWNDPVDALSKGTKSRALLYASTLYILALLVSPLSAGLLAPTDKQMSVSSTFQRAKVGKFSWRQGSEDEIMFRTISGGIIGVSTSVWISRSSAILPFWPSEYDSAPLGPNFATSLQYEQWQARTVSYTVELTCQPMHLVSRHNATYNTTEGYLNTYTFVRLGSQDDCVITLADEALPIEAPQGPWMTNGGGWWAGPPLYNTSLLLGISNSTSDCGERTMFFFATAENSPYKLRAYLCSHDFYSSDVLATVPMNQSSTNITFDQDESLRNRQPLDPAIYNISQLQESFFSPGWSTHFISSGDNTPAFGGPLISIAAGDKYGNNITKLFDSSSLPQEAKELYQQFLGEMILSSLSFGIAEDEETVSGQRVKFRRRIVVSTGIGMALVAVMLISSICVGLIAYHTSLDRRVLQLDQDPGSISAAALLISANEDVRRTFQNTDRLSQRAISYRIGRQQYMLTHGNLALLDPDNNNDCEESLPQEKTKDPRPIVFQDWTGMMLGLFLVVLTAVITVLYAVSSTAGLHEAPFVYRMNLKSMQKTTTLAPYKILPTLLALIVKLWFGAVGDTLKLLQPYMSMVKGPVPTTKSVLAEYVNTPLALATTKAFNNAHWTLALVGLGALATEIFTVGMSALWDLEIQSLNHSTIVKRHFELRTVPQIFKMGSGASHGSSFDTPHIAALSDIYRSSLQSWLYGAAVEISQSGSTPAWSKDNWSFVPLEHGDILEAVSAVELNTTSVPKHSRNITFETQGLRARLECRVLEYPKNTSLWLEHIDFTNRTINPEMNLSVWNAANSPPDLQYGYALAGMANRGPRFGYYTCCANETEGVSGETAIGYWTNQLWTENPIDYENYDQNPTGAYGGYGGFYGGSEMSMTAKLIVGRTLERLYQPNPPGENMNPPVYIWIEQPDFVLVNCTPVIERANVSVYAELETGVVYGYEILGPLEKVPEAWIDNYLVHNTSVDYDEEFETAYGTGDNVTTYENLTVSWGYLFWDALLNSGRASEVSHDLNDEYSSMPEDLSDRSFNFRIAGLNVDFMTYSMLALANNSKQALLDPEMFMKIADQTFGIFFKHFVSDHVSSDSGGGAYQPVGEKLPWSLGPMVSWSDTGGKYEYKVTGDQGFLGLENHTVPALPFVNVTVHIPVEQLVMSSVSVYLCVSLLAFLLLVTAVMYIVNHGRMKELPRNVDTLASTLAFVHGSEKLLAWTATAPRARPWYTALLSDKSDTRQPKARIGFFTSPDGVERWGIELVDASDCSGVTEAESAIELVELQPEIRPVEDNGNLAARPELLGAPESELVDDNASSTKSRSHEAEIDLGERERLIDEDRSHKVSEAET